MREPYADARRISCRPSHKAWILLQEDSNSAHTRAPVARGTAERREKDRDKDIKNCPREPRESSRGINPYKPLVRARAHERILFRARIKISIRFFLSFSLMPNASYEGRKRGRIFYSTSILHWPLNLRSRKTCTLIADGPVEATRL